MVENAWNLSFRRSALNPLLWLTLIATPPSFAAAWAADFHTIVGMVLVLLGAAPVISTIAAYVIFAIRDPDRLRSVTVSHDQALSTISLGGDRL